MIKIVILSTLLLLLPLTANAVNAWEDCDSGTALAGSVQLSKPGQRLCYPFNESLGTTGSNGLKVRILLNEALACLEPSKGDSSTDAVADVQRCVPGIAHAGTTADANFCSTILSSTKLDGTGGASSTQTRCVRIGYGT